jgi:hypothetical protein
MPVASSTSTALVSCSSEIGSEASSGRVCPLDDLAEGLGGIVALHDLRSKGKARPRPTIRDQYARQLNQSGSHRPNLRKILYVIACVARRPTKPERQGATMEEDSRETSLGNVIRIDDERVREQTAAGRRLT